MKVILSIGLLLSSLISFGQANYFDKGSGTAADLKMASAAMDMIAENNMDGVWSDYAAKTKMDTAALQEMGKTVAEYQASEGHDAVIETKEGSPVSLFERTFYQINEDGKIEYLYQIKMNISERKGKPTITAIHSLKGNAVHRYDRLLKPEADEPAEKIEKEKPERPEKKEAPERHKKGDDEDESED